VTDHKALLQHFQRDIDTGDSSILDRYIGAVYRDHHPPPFASRTPGMAGLKETFDIGLGIFSEFKHVVEDQVSEGDRVATRITGSGRHTGPFLGIPPTNRLVTMSGIAIHRVSEGRLVEHWGQVDAVGLLSQMGALPAPPALPPVAKPDSGTPASGRVLSANDMAQAVRRFFDEGLNRRTRAVLDELIDPGYVNYSLPMPSAGPEGLRAILGTFFAAFPDMHVVVEDVIAEPDKAATRGHFTGTHQGPFMDVAATGRAVTVAYIDIWKARDGRLVENWVQLDMLGLLVQLGAVPAPA
jgi:predicted ester cyclase